MERERLLIFEIIMKSLHHSALCITLQLTTYKQLSRFGLIWDVSLQFNNCKVSETKLIELIQVIGITKNIFTIFINPRIFGHIDWFRKLDAV
jgi:hypothetical protein